MRRKTTHKTGFELIQQVFYFTGVFNREKQI